MSKRDDDSVNGDMEVGMTTAERRRRRRRGGGLRVPSDNVPRRTSTPPVVAPVPEDPALAMSIAYSFSSDGSEPVARVDADEAIAPPTFIEPIAPDAGRTYVDPPANGDEGFEMKTREMSAVDLEALGLKDPSAQTPTQPSAVPSTVAEAAAVDATVQSRVATEPSIDVDMSGVDGESDRTLEPDAPPEAASVSFEPAPNVPIHSAQTGPVTTRTQADPATSRVGARERLKTVALSEEDLEEVREQVRAITAGEAGKTDGQKADGAKADGATKPTAVNTTQPLTALDVEVVDKGGSVPEIDINALVERSSSESGEIEVDVDDKSGPVAAAPPVAAAAAAAPGAAAPQPSGPTRTRAPSVPPPMPEKPVSRGTPDPDKAHAPPPPPPAAAHKPAPPAPPKAAKEHKPTPPAPAPAKDAKGRAKPWFVDLFDEDYLRTLPFLTPQATQSEAEFVIDALGLTPGAQVLDVGCGYGRHAMELAARGFHVVGLDLSTPLLVRGGEEAMRRGLEINFVRGDMRELDFDAQFDGAYCMFSTFGYFDDETNKRTVANIAKSLKPGGRVLIEILNRDYVIADLPTRVWWEGEGCVVLEEVELNYFSSRIQVNRSVVFDDGRQLEQEISVRAYSLHEVGKLMHAAGFRVLEVSGGYHTRGRFFGNQSRHIIVLAERKDPSSS